MKSNVLKHTFLCIIAMMMIFMFAIAGCKAQNDAPKATDITLSGMRTSFAYGEEFTTGGLVVTATWSDGSQSAVASNQYHVDSSAYRATESGDYEIMVTMNELSKKYTVTVAAAAGARPAVVAVSGAKNEFEFGEAFTTEGLVVSVRYSDGTRKTVSEGEYSVDSSAFNANKPGDYEIKVKVGDVSASYKATVLYPLNFNQKWKGDGVLRILTIGNSFSVDMMQYVWQIAHDLGIEQIVLGNLAIGGCTIDQHLQYIRANTANYEYYTNTAGSWSVTYNNKPQEIIASQEWDFISVQQQSSSAGAAAGLAHAHELVAEVEKYKPANAEIVWHMTWAYQGDCVEPNFAQFGFDQMTMYDGIVYNVRNYIVDNGLLSTVIPNGTAIQNVRTSYIGDKLTRDGYHLNLNFGRYIAALTCVARLTGVDIGELEWMPAETDENMRAVAIEAVQSALRKPFTVTQSSYTQSRRG